MASLAAHALFLNRKLNPAKLDFRPAREQGLLSLDARVLHLWACVPSPSPLEPLNDYVAGRRGTSTTRLLERDHVLASSVLLIKELMHYREWATATACGDGARVNEGIQYQTVMFASTSHHNYLHDGLEMISTVDFEMSP
ncbi:hypothetical protein JCM8547_006056 [Rhodosporidiobolus lusitaniae]